MRSENSKAEEFQIAELLFLGALAAVARLKKRGALTVGLRAGLGGYGLGIFGVCY